VHIVIKSDFNELEDVLGVLGRFFCKADFGVLEIDIAYSQKGYNL